MGEAIVFTSGKGGVGKTTVISNIGVELSQLDKKVIMLDTDMGLRNLDLVMGIEDKVNYNILDILNRSCRIRQAIIRNKKYPNLYVIPAAPSMDTLCSYEARFKILIEELKASFDYCLIDSLAGGIEFQARSSASLSHSSASCSLRSIPLATLRRSFP